MKNISHIKTFLFLISTLTFSAISFVMRNILIYNYNDIDLKLFKIEYIKNYGAAFSILNSHTLFLTIFSSIILFFTMFYILKNLKNNINPNTPFCDVFGFLYTILIENNYLSSDHFCCVITAGT